MTLEIRRLKPEETHGLRHQVLRPNQPPEACIYPGDDDQTTFHLGAYRQGELICIASFWLKKKHMPVFIFKSHKFIFYARAVSRTRTLDFSRIHRGKV